MDWGELVEQAKNNPEVKALLGKIMGTTEELPAGESSAVSSARDVTNSTPSITGKVTEPTVNMSSSGSEPPPPELPADQSTMVSDEPEGTSSDDGEAKSPMSLKQKAAIGAGVAGAGLGAASMLQKDDDTSSMAPASAPSGTSSPAAQAPITAEPQDDSDELNDAQDEDTDLKSAAKPAKQASNEEVDPKEAKMRQAIANILNFGGQQSAGPNALDKAIAERRSMLNQAEMNEGFARIGAGIARVNPNVSIYENQKKMANMPLEEYQLRQKNEENDPNSGLSSGLRDYIKTLGVQVSDSANAAQIKQVLPLVFKDLEARQSQAAKHEDLQERMREANQRHQDQLAYIQAQKELTRNDKLAKQGVDQFNKGVQQAESVRGNRAIQNDMQTLQRVQNAMSIIKQYKDPNDIPAPILNTFDADLATIMMGGSPGEGVMKEVADPSVQKDLAQFWSKWSNKPQGARASAFVQQKSKIFNTLANDAQDRINKRYERIGNTMGMNWSPDQKQAYLSEYFPGNSYGLDHTGKFTKTNLPHQGKYPPGSTVMVQGRPAKVGPDGDTLLDPQTGQPLK